MTLIHGAAAGGTDQERWDFWGRFMQPLIATRPHQAVAGNHEIETVSAPPCPSIQRTGAIGECYYPNFDTATRQCGTITLAVVMYTLLTQLVSISFLVLFHSQMF